MGILNRNLVSFSIQTHLTWYFCILKRRYITRFFTNSNIHQPYLTLPFPFSFHTMPARPTTCSCKPRRNISISRPFRITRLRVDEACPNGPAHIGNKGYAASLRAVASQYARARVDNVVHDGVRVSANKAEVEDEG
ncbi:hypothetical protein HBH53_131070 [Parastagonospora nodorum]|nr:hypothetical protein HBH53_131070 [Parastagonospora nodorum]KAH4071971.1 hypothetical protein HBH50_071020 [Parastagonospora nodorum]KAH4094855.1 hypothetical protein HBH48_059280 [Parastagonospora nodorum]KAH4856200.1 hypothetical protein HBH75_076730 [Parastagonospora nodorum]KAH4939260.1 hypothetical protein HBI79_048470 [Parastagonospora nodorum]